MNEDEAFIRAIVDNPGDDTSRLVYADWLDDRGDPRGPYLRAEHEWAKPWREGKRPSENPELREMATGLDPVWIARVSRPPMGVCCEQLTMSRCGVPLDTEALDRCESRLRLKLPGDYRAFLSRWNGGVPEPRYCWPPDSRYVGGRWVYIQQFFTVLDRKSEAELTNAEKNRDLEEATKVLNNGYISRSVDQAAREAWEAGTRQFVALAEPAELGVIALGLSGRRAGKVYEVNRPTLAGSSPPRLVAPSLPAFLALFRPRND